MLRAGVACTHARGWQSHAHGELTCTQLQVCGADVQQREKACEIVCTCVRACVRACARACVRARRCAPVEPREASAPQRRRRDSSLCRSRPSADCTRTRRNCSSSA
eukprot:3831774-Pleurochrysis_carterae.AAC.2